MGSVDEADRAQVEEERGREEAIRHRQPSLNATGFCWNCAGKLGGSLLFCGPDCRDDYDREHAIRAHQGGHKPR